MQNHVHAVDRPGPGGRRDEVKKQIDGCCFARAIGAKQTESLAGCNGEAQRVERSRAAAELR